MPSWRGYVGKDSDLLKVCVSRNTGIGGKCESRIDPTQQWVVRFQIEGVRAGMGEAGCY